MTFLKRLVIVILVLVVVSAAVIFITASSSSTAWPTLKSSGTANPNDVVGMESLVNKYFDITGEAAGTFDLSQFPSLFINDPSVPLTPYQTDFMNTIGAKGSGVLSYELAFFNDWKQGAERLEKLQAQLKAENRQITESDIKSISGPNGMPAPRRQGPTHKTVVFFNSFTVDGSRAIVNYDCPGLTQEVFLVKTSNGWRIAGIRTLKVTA